jgi:transposase InsO family protein
MPWTKTTAQEERARFIRLIREMTLPFTEACELVGISRKTGYKWLGRFESEGGAGLADRSSAPRSHPNAVTADVRERVLDFRRAHRSWGPDKLLVGLEREDPETDWPAASTVAVMLKAAGLVTPRRRRRRTPPMTQPFAPCTQPNDLWCIDFKGQFPVGGRLCYPLTITDAFSRYILACDGLRSTETKPARAVLERVFHEYGLPSAIRSDNGIPFASTSAGGLSQLSVWWVHLGITPERIEPGAPQQNGRHERMHLTLKQDVASPPQRTFAAQQRAFDAWRQEFNTFRPHEALGMQTPSGLYVPSPRPMPRRLPELEYPDGWELRRVRHDGTMKWHRRHVYVGAPLIGELVGLRPEECGLWTVFLGPVLLGRVHDEALDEGLVRPGRRQYRQEGDEEGA